MWSSEPTDEPVDHFLFAERPTDRGQNLHVDSNSEALAVDEHPVAVEDHEAISLGHGDTLRSGPVRSAGAG